MRTHSVSSGLATVKEIPGPCLEGANIPMVHWRSGQQSELTVAE
jgi:hypothetical protein